MKEAEELVATAIRTRLAVVTGAAVTGRDRQREQTRRRVRECALAIFRRDGLAAARIDDIVRAARVSRGTFYFHFPTKEDVIVEVLRESEHRIAAAIAKLPKSTGLARVLEVTCEKIAEEWEGEPRLFQDVGAVAVRRAAAAFREGQRDAVSQALADGFRAAVERKELTEFLPAEVLADFFLVNAFSAALSWCAYPKTPLRVVFSSVIGIFLNGARAQRRARQVDRAVRARHAGSALRSRGRA
jgi:AcrR family transcriptional regulator